MAKRLPSLNSSIWPSARKAALLMSVVLIATTSPVGARPVWQAWERRDPSKPLPFDSGFSNLELGGYLEYEHACDRAARQEDTEPSYWYRLNDWVETLGTGEVEWGCKVGDRFVATHPSTAIWSGLDTPVCLQAIADPPQDISVRNEPKLSATPMDILPGGTKLWLDSLPALIVADSAGHWWLSIRQKDAHGWVLLATDEEDGTYYQRCSLRKIK